MHKRIGWAQLGARNEKEKGSAGAVRDAKLAQRFHHRLRTMAVGRDGEHAERLPSEMLLVLLFVLPTPGAEVSEICRAYSSFFSNQAPNRSFTNSCVWLAVSSDVAAPVRT